jgi:SAM-dependent methyltransferase
VLSAPIGAPRLFEASIGTMTRGARYDGVADWYDETMAGSELALADQQLALRLLGRGPGRLLDVGCGGGRHMLAFAAAGWTPVGVDVSQDQLRLARERGCDVVQGRAEELPFDDDSFAGAVSMWTHTDVEDFAQALREIARVLRPGGAFVYLGVHPCFVGPHSQFVAGEGVPILHPGYRRAGRYDDGPGISPAGLRARVGAVHLPLGTFLQAFLDAGLALERFEEPGSRDYPVPVALRARAP